VTATLQSTPVNSCTFTKFDRVNAMIRVDDEAANLNETHEHKGDFKEW